MSTRNKRCNKNRSKVFSKEEKRLIVPDLKIREADDYPLNVEKSGKIDDLEKITLHKGRYFLTIILGGLLSLIVIGVSAIGAFKNDWRPWQQMQLFVTSTFSLLLGFYFGRK
jgi:hypothetical protein